MCSANSFPLMADCRVVESFESQHRTDPLFDSAVVLFDEIGSIALLLDVDVPRSPSSPALRDATPHKASRVILVGVRWFFIALRRKVLAAVTSRFRLRKKSTVQPALSTARYR